MDENKICLFQKRISEVRGIDVEVVVVRDGLDVDDTDIRDDLVYLIPDRRLYERIVKRVEEHQLPSFFDRVSCPMDSDLTPHHEKVRDLKEIIMYKNKEFPRIKFNDPVVKWNNWKCDSFIRIKRKNGKYYYRHLYCSKRCNHEGDYTF